MKPPIKEPFVLNLTERESSVWTRVKANLTEVLQELRIKNDAKLSEEETAFLRGRIHMVKEVLKAGEPLPDFKKFDS